MTIFGEIEKLPPIPRAIWTKRIHAMIIQHAIDRGHINLEAMAKRKAGR